jgi:hypothetical protein
MLLARVLGGTDPAPAAVPGAPMICDQSSTAPKNLCFVQQCVQRPAWRMQSLLSTNGG